jgi:hypothetical protein
MYRRYGRTFWELAHDKLEVVARKGQPGDSLLWDGLNAQQARQTLSRLRALLAGRPKVLLAPTPIADGWHLIPALLLNELRLLGRIAFELWTGRLPTETSYFSDKLMDYGCYSPYFERAIFHSCAHAGAQAAVKPLSRLQRSLLRFARCYPGTSWAPLCRYQRPPGCLPAALSRALHRLEERLLIELRRSKGGRATDLRLTPRCSLVASTI